MATTLKYGSSGDEVKKLQETLNATGNYNLATDGKFGAKTQEAVKAYQKANGLTVDGIVGTNTWGALNKASTTTTPSATTPTTSTTSTTPAKKPSDFTYADYEESDIVKQANAMLQQQIANKPGEYQSNWQSQLDETLNKILNREKFSYDLNGDALYQQYKDQYMLQGQQAMMDTMGQAQAMTGGYGNSYAQTVGQQTYQGYLQQLNDKVPELYQLALSQYNQEGQDLYNQYGLYADRESQDYGRYRDNVSDYYTELDRLTEDARYKSEDEYGRYMDKVNMDYTLFSDDITNEWKQKEFDEALRQYNETMAYQKDRDAVADSQWQKQYELAKSSASSSGGTDGTDGDTTETSGVPTSVNNKASSFSNNDDLANYIDGLTSSGVITESEADALYAQYKTPEQVALDKRTWTLVDDGGINWFWGIDGNASVKDQYGNKYTLDKLVTALEAEGWSRSDAKEYVKKLQKRLGA